MIPKVSVILPFFNAELTLERATQSIIKQSFINFECLLIDNNSEDGSRIIAQQIVQADSRFHLLSEPNQGVSHASNYGSQNAKATYIARMDADDYAMPNRLQLQVDFLDKNPSIGVVSGMVEYMGHSNNTQGFERYVDWVNSVQSHDEILKNMFVESPIVNPSAMWRAEIGKHYGMYRQGDFPEDYEMWLRWLSMGVKMEKLNQYLLKWYDSDSRLTRTHEAYSDAAFFRIKTKYLANWLQLHNPHHPRVILWGASRISRKRAILLEKYGVEISAYVDINKDRQLSKDVIYYTHLPPPSEAFILVYIKQVKLKIEIQKFLRKKGYTEGKNYLLVS